MSADGSPMRADNTPSRTCGWHVERIDRHMMIAERRGAVIRVRIVLDRLPEAGPMQAFVRVLVIHVTHGAIRCLLVDNCDLVGLRAGAFVDLPRGTTRHERKQTQVPNGEI